jgi:hypothetical protein
MLRFCVRILTKVDAKRERIDALRNAMSLIVVSLILLKDARN